MTERPATEHQKPTRHDPVTDFPGGVDRVVIVHGYNGYPAKHWFPWLAGELVAAGFPVTRVALPEPTRPDPEAWAEALATQTGSLDGAVVVAHSLGCFTTLRHIADHPGQSLKGLVLVAGFDCTGADLAGGTEAERTVLSMLDPFLGDGVDTAALVPRLGEVTVIRSDDDPIVPPVYSDEMAARLGVEPVILPGRGHFMFRNGVTELPEARDAVLGTLGA